MLDTEGFITEIRNIIADNTSLALTQVYTPDLPSEGTNICAVTMLAGNNLYNLCEVEYFDFTFRVIIRGTSNDNSTRELTDEIYNALNLRSDEVFNTSTIVHILANNTPTYIGKDENQNNLYNITYRAIVKGE
jgi:hypothetical protein